ncbi:sensor histidine kinase [Salinactinospora qingdaonensis]|uniref:Histidine kinase-like ATPase domain-containing protein n=1 Tax=Salinactinospora qingdaonensis TaxID=702744 RepID=A0ABP7FUI9_9ACTN
MVSRRGAHRRQYIAAQRLSRLNAVLRLEGPTDSQVPDDVGEHVLAVVGEALSNLARHAQAPRVEIRILVDDGVGFA